MNNAIICVDFDGVINSYKSGWEGIDVISDDPVPGAIEWLMQHLPTPEPICAMAEPYKGPEVQIYSSRSKDAKGVTAMKAWLLKHGLHPAYLSEDILKFPTQKPAAFLTIDDRAICFEGRFPTSEEMLAFKPWNKKEFGATGAFPDSKSQHDDEGQLRLGVAHDQDFVHINFGKVVAWLLLSRDEAKAFAKMIDMHAEQLRP